MEYTYGEGEVHPEFEGEEAVEYEADEGFSEDESDERE
jgi:hypothetical protein